MTTPQGPQLDINELAAEMERDPLSKALWENAQLRVIVRRQQARIDELQSQRPSES